MNLLVAAWWFLPTLLGQNGPLSYAEAYQLALTKNRPLVVLVGAAWCPACKLMEQELAPRLLGKRYQDQVAFVLVDIDREPKVGHQLVGEGPIPQLFLFRRVGQRWRAVRLVGLQEFSVVEQHIARLTNDQQAPEKGETHQTVMAPPPPPGPKVQLSVSAQAPGQNSGR